MSRTTAPGVGGTMRPSRPQWVRAAHRHLQVYLLLWVWFWALCVTGIVVAVVVVDQVGTVDVSIAQFVRNGPLPWFVFALAVTVASMYLTPHVANGMTRGSFTRGALVAGGANGVLHGATASVVVLVEGLVYERMGWPHGMPGEGPTAGIWEQGAGVLLLDYTLAALGGAVSGLLVGIAYYRLGGWWGTLALPLTLLPVLGLMFLTSWAYDWMPWRVGQTVAGTTVAAVLVLAGAAAFTLLVRNVAINRTES